MASWIDPKLRGIFPVTRQSTTSKKFPRFSIFKFRVLTGKNIVQGCEVYDCGRITVGALGNFTSQNIRENSDGIKIAHSAQIWEISINIIVIKPDLQWRVNFPPYIQIQIQTHDGKIGHRCEISRDLIFDQIDFESQNTKWVETFPRNRKFRKKTIIRLEHVQIWRVHYLIGYLS